jgi:DNA replication and repair protein RecF
MLLDDVMSELDRQRRQRLVARLEGGQALVTTTDLEHVPGGDGPEVQRIAVADGAARADAAAAPHRSAVAA